jgi:hypothetical protein
MWYKMTVVYETAMNATQHAAFRFPRSGLWVLMRHASGPCGLWNMPRGTSLAVTSDQMCGYDMTQASICPMCDTVCSRPEATSLRMLRDKLQESAPLRLVQWQRLVIDEYHSVSKPEQFASLFFRNAWIVSATVDKDASSLAFIGRSFFAMPLVHKNHPKYLRLWSVTSGQDMLSIM